MAYKDSDYTVVIAMMQWHKIKIIVLKLTLVVEIWTLLSRRWPPLLGRSLRLPVAVLFFGKAHEDSDHTALIAVVHWRLHAKTHRAGEVASAVIMSCLPFGRHCSQSTERGCHVACARVNWNVLRYATGVATLLHILYSVIIGTNWHT